MAVKSVNRRGFLGSIAGCIAAVASRFRPSPTACVACGSDSHVTSLCPINNAAMAGRHDWFTHSDGRILFSIFDSGGNVSHYSAFPSSAYDKSNWSMDMIQQIIICGGNSTARELAMTSAMLEARRA